MMRDNNVYDELERVIRGTVGPSLDGYGGSRVPKLVDAILSAFEVKPIIKKHRPCSCGSQFQIFTTEKKDEWLFICDNESTCCKVVSMRIKAKTPENAWLVWDKAVYLHSMDRAEQKIQVENVKPRPNCSQNIKCKQCEDRGRYYNYNISLWVDCDCKNSGLKECAKALVDKLKLIKEDGGMDSIFIFAANHGCTYSGPNYSQELKILEEILNKSNYDRSSMS